MISWFEFLYVVLKGNSHFPWLHTPCQHQKAGSKLTYGYLDPKKLFSIFLSISLIICTMKVKMSLARAIKVWFNIDLDELLESDMFGFRSQVQIMLFSRIGLSDFDFHMGCCNIHTPPIRVCTGHGKPGMSWNFIFQSWKVMEFNCRSLKVM